MGFYQKVEAYFLFMAHDNRVKCYTAVQNK